jgi:hypothetical protein
MHHFSDRAEDNSIYSEPMRNKTWATQKAQ